MRTEDTIQRPGLAGPDPIRPPYDGRVAMILLIVEWVLAFAGLVVLVVAGWQPTRCDESNDCDLDLASTATTLWVWVTVGSLVLSTVAAYVCRVRRVSAWWAPLTGILLIFAVNVLVHVWTTMALR